MQMPPFAGAFIVSFDYIGRTDLGEYVCERIVVAWHVFHRIREADHLFHRPTKIGIIHSI